MPDNAVLCWARVPTEGYAVIIGNHGRVTHGRVTHTYTTVEPCDYCGHDRENHTNSHNGYRCVICPCMTYIEKEHEQETMP